MTLQPTSLTVSDLYYACRNGLTDQVRQQLAKLSLNDIDRIQTNGSTALHAACFYGHAEIVKLLLDRGASRSIVNSHNCLAYDEARNESIKKLFERQSTRRFCDSQPEYSDWIQNPNQKGSHTNDLRFRSNGTSWMNKNVAHLLTDINDQMPNAEKNRINLFITQGQINPIYLLKAFTTESQFYISINRNLARIQSNETIQTGIAAFVDCFYNSPMLENLSYNGKTFRGMCVAQDDLRNYSVGTVVMARTFLSTTKDRKLVEEFVLKSFHSSKKQQNSGTKAFVLCTYEILKRRTGLDIEGLSEYRHEKEVLIGPYTTFLINTRRQISQNYVEISLQECDRELGQGDDDFDDD